jgi:hypothetical protein
VIDGFLDILLPVDGQSQTKENIPVYGHQHVPGVKREKRQKLLFTVKSGGIAGYLCKFVFPFVTGY